MFLNMSCRTLLNVCRFFSLNASGKGLCSQRAGEIQRTLPDTEFELDYLTNPYNSKDIEDNIQNRKGIGDVKKVLAINEELKAERNPLKIKSLQSELFKELSKIPNKSHPIVKSYGDIPKIVKTIPFVKHPFKAKECSSLMKDLNIARTEGLGLLTGHKSYFFMGDLAELEQALIKYTLSKLISRGFQMVSVPDILPGETIERCGMSVQGNRSQVYLLEDSHGDNLCLSGTSEISLAGLLRDSIHDVVNLPLMLTAVSRCFRSETSNIAEERGIYRVHQFTKVEMFGLSHPDKSGQLLQQFLDIEEENFQDLGLSYQVLDMPMCELGAPAYRKFDIEAWLPGREMYGEVSSCSDCTCYQARRLNIRYRQDGELRHVHTVNGTACAVPRMMIALLETHQTREGNVKIPQALRPYLKGISEIQKQKSVPIVMSKPKEKTVRVNRHHIY